MKRYITYLIIVLLAVAEGCKCGSTSSNSDVVNSSAFDTEVKIRMEENPIYPANENEIVIAVDITGAVNVAGVYFNLNYDPKVIQLKDIDYPARSLTLDELFCQGGVSIGTGIGFYENSDSTLSDSSLTLGLSRVGESPGISGSGKILELKFITISTGSTLVQFSETADKSLLTPELVKIPGVKWTNTEVMVK